MSKDNIIYIQQQENDSWDVWEQAASVDPGEASINGLMFKEEISAYRYALREQIARDTEYGVHLLARKEKPKQVRCKEYWVNSYFGSMLSKPYENKSEAKERCTDNCEGQIRVIEPLHHDVVFKELCIGFNSEVMKIIMTKLSKLGMVKEDE